MSGKNSKKRKAEETDDSPSKKQEVEAPLNVILFGPSQQGKTSVLANLSESLKLPHKDLKIGGNMIGETFKTTSRILTISGKDFQIFDTAGLNEGQGGQVNPAEAFANLKNLLTSLKNGVALMIYVKKKGAFTGLDDNNIQLFRVLCGKEVPLMILVNDADVDAELDDTDYNEFKRGLETAWDDYLAKNKKHINTEPHRFDYSVCGFNSRTGTLAATGVGKWMRRASAEVLLDKIEACALENHSLYKDFSTLAILFRRVWNFFVGLFADWTSFLFKWDDSDIKKNFSLFSKKICEILIKMGLKEEEALNLAAEFDGEFND